MKRPDFKKSTQVGRKLFRKIIASSFVAILIATHSLAQTAPGNSIIESTTSTVNKVEMMTKEDFSTTILVSQSSQEVFNAINNVRSWWQGEVKGSTDKLHDEFIYRMGEIHYSKQKIVEVIPGKKIVWLVTESNLNFAKDKSEWTGTKIVFEISERNNQTQLQFTHIGLIPTFECYGNCSNAWEQLIQESLFSLITTGKGKNVFNK